VGLGGNVLVEKVYRTNRTCILYHSASPLNTTIPLAITVTSLVPASSAKARPTHSAQSAMDKSIAARE